LWIRSGREAERVFLRIGRTAAYLNAETRREWWNEQLERACASLNSSLSPPPAGLLTSGHEEGGSRPSSSSGSSFSQPPLEFMEQMETYFGFRGESIDPSAYNPRPDSSRSVQSRGDRRGSARDSRPSSSHGGPAHRGGLGGAHHSGL